MISPYVFQILIKEYRESLYPNKTKKDVNYDYDIVVNTVCLHFNIDKKLLGSNTKKPKIVDAKLICAYILKTKSRYTSLKTISEIMGGGHHTTIINRIKKTERYLKVDKQFKINYDQILYKLNK